MEKVAAMRVLIASAAVLWLPGFVLSRLLGIRFQQPENWAVPIGLSLAINAVAAQWLHLAHLRLTGESLVLTYGALTVLALLLGTTAFGRSGANQGQRHGLKKPGQGTGALQFRLTVRHCLASLTSPKMRIKIALPLVVAATLLLRFAQVGDLALPAWVDALHHTTIVKTIQSEQQLPDTLAAYGDVPFYYHFGFHVSAALFASIVAIEAQQAVLVVSQILNGLIVLSVFGLAQRLTRSRITALTAAVLTGAVSTMPAYYAAWSRSTFTIGMLLLPIAMATLWDVCETTTWRHIVCLVLLGAGLLLSHYVIVAYFLCFVPVALSFFQRCHAASNAICRSQRMRAAVFAVFGGLLLDAPWLFRIAPHIIPQAGVCTGFGPMPQRLQVLQERLVYLWRLIGQPRSLTIAAIAVSMALIAIRRNRPSAVLVYWVGLLLLLGQQFLCQISPFRV